MEAGKVGLPLISTPVSGIPELVRHDQTGWLVPSGDAAALADAVAALVANPAVGARLGQNARALVEAQFNIESSARLLAALFQDTYQQWKRSRVTAFSQSTPGSRFNSVR
jgi:glycosyltransferase involved in cell wall biosynthesis